MEGASAWGGATPTPGNGPYASTSTSTFAPGEPLFPEVETQDPPEAFNPYEADDRSVLMEVYHEIMNMRGQMALLRTEYADFVAERRHRDTHIDRELAAASAQVVFINNAVQNLMNRPIAAPVPQPPGPQPPVPQPPAPLPPLPPRPQPQGGAPKLKMATPKAFNGKNEEATMFQVNCNMYIQGTAPNATEDQKVGAVVSYMEGAAREWLQTFLETDLITPVPWLHNLTLFWQEFQVRFGEVDREDKNPAKFNKLKQTGSIQDYQRDFQRFATGLQYGDHALRDKFYEGLKDDIKSMMITQMFDPYDAAETLQTVAARATLIYNKLEQLKPLNKQVATSGKSSNAPTSVTTGPPTPRAPRERLNIGDNVYMIGQDGRAKKGKITGEGKNSRGAITPTVKWSTGESSSVPYPALKKDSRPIMSSSAPTKPDPKGPGPMEVDGRGRPQVTCNSCGGKGHFARVCPSRPMSGHAAKVGEEKLIDIESDEEEESGKGDAKTH